MRQRLEDALRASDAEFADIRIEDDTSSWVDYRGEELDRIGSSKTVGGIVRALVKGGWGYSTFNDLGDLEARVAEACESARLVGQEESHFAPVEPVVDEITAELEVDFTEVPLSRKREVIQEYNQIILGYHPKIQTSWVSYRDSYSQLWYANTEGAYIADVQPDVYAFIMATARDGDIVQRAYETNGGSAGFQLVEGLQTGAELAAKRSVDLLSAPPVTGGTYPVVINPVMTGLFAHEAFGHLSEADNIYENERMRELMQLGKRFGSDFLNIVDDGLLPGQLGSHPYDFEGVRTRKNYLIRDGILVGRLHSRETAAKMGEQPTGNARSVGYQCPSIVRMTNTYIEKGTATFEDMIADVDLGIYAIDEAGGQTAMEMFTFRAAYAYMIRDGQIGELIRDVVLTGNVFETMMNIDMLGDTVEWAPGGPFGCGKSGQNGLLTGVGGPHTRIQNVVIGGPQ